MSTVHEYEPPVDDEVSTDGVPRLVAWPLRSEISAGCRRESAKERGGQWIMGEKERTYSAVSEGVGHVDYLTAVYGFEDRGKCNAGLSGDGSRHGEGAEGEGL